MHTLILVLPIIGACGGGAVDKAAHCASTFGDALTNGFGRFDGTLRAVVPPTNTTCAMPNSTHLVLELDANDVTYRMVVDVLSSQGSPDVHYFAEAAPLEGAPFSPGWHLGESLDYVTDLGVHSTSFVATPEAELVQTITDQLTLGHDLSVYATSMDEPSSAHLVHYEGPNIDGAIVVDPTGKSPRYLLMAFDEQTF